MTRLDKAKRRSAYMALYMAFHTQFTLAAWVARHVLRGCSEGLTEKERLWLSKRVSQSNELANDWRWMAWRLEGLPSGRRPRK